MPGNQIYPRSGYPLSRAELKKNMGKMRPLYQFLDEYARRDVVQEFYDFNNKQLDTTNVWTVQAGATATTWAVNSQEDGVIRGASGTTAATSGLQLGLAGATKYWFGDRNCGMEVRYKISAITEIRIEIGFVDAIPAINTNIVNNLSTPTYNTAVEAALFVYDNASAVTTSGLYTAGTGFPSAKQATTTNRPVAATYQTVRVQVLTNRAYLWVDGILLATADSGSTDYIEGSNGLIPVFSQKTSDTTSKNIDIDYVRVWKDRNVP